MLFNSNNLTISLDLKTLSNNQSDVVKLVNDIIKYNPHNPNDLKKIDNEARIKEIIQSLKKTKIQWNYIIPFCSGLISIKKKSKYTEQLLELNKLKERIADKIRTISLVRIRCATDDGSVYMQIDAGKNDHLLKLLLVLNSIKLDQIAKCTEESCEQVYIALRPNRNRFCSECCSKRAYDKTPDGILSKNRRYERHAKKQKRL